MSEQPDQPDQPEVWTAPLPGPVRLRVVALAAQALGTLTGDEIPTSLRAVARFVPARRARSGAAQLALALESDPGFRQRVASFARSAQPALASALDRGEALPSADPLEVAVVAYLLRPAGWTAAVRQAAGALAAAEQEAGHARAADAVSRLTDQIDAVRAQGRAALERARSESAQQADELTAARRRIRELEAELKRARAGLAAATADAADAERTAAEALAAADLERRRLRTRLADAEAGLDAARRGAREGRNVDSVRLRLLMDTVLEAAQGLRRELALPPLSGRPADVVAAAAVTPVPAGVADVANRALTVDDPALLDQLLELPQVHLVVDGYNVTKTGYGTLSLAEQRTRLVTGLGVLASRTRAEVTCVFDGTTLDVRVVQAGPRGVRVLFSPEGETADELILRLVRAEPAGRPVVVVSADREVAEGARAAGARPVASTALLRRLDRG